MVQQNYFEGPTKLFSDLYPAKFYIPQQNRFIRVFVEEILLCFSLSIHEFATQVVYQIL